LRALGIVGGKAINEVPPRLKLSSFVSF